MGKEGPCCHCRIQNTPLWRHGPADKPVLCNACGSRWRIQGTLYDYFPKHGFTGTSKLNLPFNEKSGMPVEDHNNMKSILQRKTGSQEISLCNYTHTGSLVAKVRGLPFSLKVPRKKRSILKQYYLTSTGRLHRQLLWILQEQQSKSTNSSNPAAIDDDLLFMPNNMMFSSNETALGAMLLKKSSN